jgi:AcrR family transcriptional regulator
MPRVALTEEEVAAFRRRAVGVALRLFGERGWDSVTMRALAGDLGCSAMTPYRYIANKDHLLAMVRAEAFRRFADRLADAFDGSADGARNDDQEGGDKGAALARLRRLKRSYVRFARDEPDAYRIMFELKQATEVEHAPSLAIRLPSRTCFGPTPMVWCRSS